MKTVFENNIRDLINALCEISRDGFFKMNEAARVTAAALLAGGKLLACGNGGSAATASHIVNDLACHMKNWDRRGYRVFSLCDSTAVVTSLCNDYGMEYVFSKQVDALGEAGDVLWAFSTSGNSKNVVEAILKAKALGMKCVAFTGQKGGAMKDLADVWLAAPSDEVMRVEEMHLI